MMWLYSLLARIKCNKILKYLPTTKMQKLETELVDKTNILVRNKKDRDNVNERFTCRGQLLEEVTSYKYSGSNK